MTIISKLQQKLNLEQSEEVKAETTETAKESSEKEEAKDDKEESTT